MPLQAYALVLAALVLLLAPACSRAAGTGLETPLLVTQVPVGTERTPAGWQPDQLVRADWFEGARLVVVSPDGQQRVLSAGFAAAADPNVSFDGTRVLFAGQKERGSAWRIWEIGPDGRDLRPVSPENQDARGPIYATTLFTLDSPQPWFTVIYSAREAILNEIGRPAASSLYNVKLDGTELRRLTFNPNHNFDPVQTWDGRVLYAAERYGLEPGAAGGHVGLYAIHVEGADMEFYGGEQGGRIQHLPCATEGGWVVFVEAERGRWDGAGQLACVHESRPHVSYRRLTDDPAWRYLYPSPWQGNDLLVARRAANGKGTWGIVKLRAGQTQGETVFDTPDYHDLQAVPLRPRARPDGHSTVVNPKTNSGIFYGLNCYTTDAARQPHLRKGEIKRVRFLEGLLRPASAAAPHQMAGDRIIPRRLLGEAPVEADGSFNVEVPADTPLLLQTLDERGLALGNCGWIWVKPKETRGCIGCHEDPELIPENEYVLALRRPSNQLLLPPAQRRSVTFRDDIAPLLQRHCATADCHAGSRTPLRLPAATGKQTEADLRAAYTLMLTPRQPTAGGVEPPAGRYVDVGRARTSWLVWQLMGTNTARPWDSRESPAATSARAVKPMPPPGLGTPLDPEELRTVVQWIDLGAPFQAVPTPETSPSASLPPTP